MASAVKYLRYMAHEQPVFLWSCIIGAIGEPSFFFCLSSILCGHITLTRHALLGPIMVLTVPKFRREYMGFKPAPLLPTTYPSTLYPFSFSLMPNSYRIDLTLFTIIPLQPHAVPNRPRNPPAGFEDPETA
ncbi:hypothetical protein BC937DRAFT_88463 [Endogone sp. FLAS-F59071]|nr:hypothetical protein BC937DRAFT_88463 [Endogone sp. FLAS-F59071]|eukprot:RUS18676.1 hypothetical protein BC937DRAFT_88463 [Endogone sp. FLAS-F59071]